MRILEACIESVESAVAAEAGGASRVELCANLIEGGTTPSSGMVKAVQRACTLPIMMMTRPRGGDFLYSDHELMVMEQDILEAKSLGVEGIVLGLLTTDGKVDIEKTRHLIHLAAPLKVTFHRAFDMTPDPFEALSSLVDLGVSRVLTSGQEASAPEGAGLISKLVEMANGRITILPGGGIDESNIQVLSEIEGLQEFHATGSEVTSSAMEFKNEKIYMGSPGLPEYSLVRTSQEKIRKMIAVLR